VTLGFSGVGAPDFLMLPGLINAHDHLQLNNVPLLVHSEPYANSYEWIDAFESHRGDPAVEAAVAVPSAARHWQGGLKNLLAGVTRVAHHDPWNASFDDPEFPVEVVREYGWSHSLRLGERSGDRAPRYGPSVRESFERTRSGLPWIIHLAEGTDAVARTELAILDDLGCLAANTVLVHGVGLTSADIDRVLERGASVVWCPSSNIGMFGRTLEPRTIRRLFDAGRLALGTDSRLTGSRDMLDELRIAAANSDLTPPELLRLGTTLNASVLRLEHRDPHVAGRGSDCVMVRARGGADPSSTLLGASRSELLAVVKGAVPMIAEPEFARLFEVSDTPTVAVSLDGRPKLIAKQLLRPDMTAVEPGLKIEAGSCVS